MYIRPAQFSDAPVLMQLFYDTVHRVNAQAQEVERHGVLLRNFVMDKNLNNTVKSATPFTVQSKDCKG